jgi:hypothetical protein
VSAGPSAADTGATSADAGGQAVEAPAPATSAAATALPPKRKAKAAKPGKVAAAETPTPRAGTKQALMIELLKRPKGATVEQIAAATGVEWRRSALPPCGDRFLRPPLRTGRASFPASGSPCSAYG